LLVAAIFGRAFSEVLRRSTARKALIAVVAIFSVYRRRRRADFYFSQLMPIGTGRTAQ